MPSIKSKNFFLEEKWAGMLFRKCAKNRERKLLRSAMEDVEGTGPIKGNDTMNNHRIN